MGWIVRLDEKGRVVIPREVREQLAITTGSKLIVERDGERIVFEPIEGKGENYNERSNKSEPNEDHLKEFLSGFADNINYEDSAHLPSSNAS